MQRRKIRKYGKRSLIAFLPCFLVCFMYFVWGPMEVYLANPTDFTFTFWSAVLPLFAAAAALSIAAALLIGFLRHIPYRIAVGLLTGVALASYIQNMFLNLNLGLLEGNAINWSAFQDHGFYNLLIYMGIILIVALLIVCFRKYYRRGVVMICSLLLVMQFSAFAITSVSSAIYKDRDANSYILSGNEQFTVSPNENIIVFVLDYFSNSYYNSAVRLYPEIAEVLKDFTYYNNCDPTYIGTFPSMTHLLTGYPFDTTAPIDTWFQNAWQSESAETFYQAMQTANYKTRLYSTATKCMGLMYADGKIDNLIDAAEYDAANVFHTDELFDKMLTLSCYRYFPHVLKKYFTLTTGDFSSIYTTKLDNVSRVLNHLTFNLHVTTNGLSLAAAPDNLLIIQHLRGTHPPYFIDENVVYSPNPTLEQSAAGNIKIVGHYLDQLKALGKYDDATIIVTSDHGDKDNNMQTIYFIKEPGVTRERTAVSTAPISHNDFEGTLLTLAGITEDPLDRTSIYDFKPGEARVRTVMRNYIDSSLPRVKKYNSTVLGTHTAMYEYTYEGDFKELRKQFRRGPTKILPLTESFN